MSGPRVRTKVEPDLDPFRSQVQKKDPYPNSSTYRGPNKDPNPIFNGSERSSNQRIKDPFISLILYIKASMGRQYCSCYSKVFQFHY